MTMRCRFSLLLIAIFAASAAIAAARSNPTIRTSLNHLIIFPVGLYFAFMVLLLFPPSIPRVIS